MPATVDDLQIAFNEVFDHLSQEAQDQIFTRDIPFIGALASVAGGALAIIEDARAEIQAALAEIDDSGEIDLAAALASALNGVAFLDATADGDDGLIISFDTNQPGVTGNTADLGQFGVAADLGFPSLGLDIGAGIALAGEIDLDFDFALDLGSGDLALTGGDGLTLALNGDLETDGDLRLGFLDLDVMEAAPEEGEDFLNGLALSFNLNFGDDIAALPTASLTGDARLDLVVSTELLPGSPLSDFLPTFSTNFVLDYGFDADLGEGAVIGALEAVEFNDISVEIAILSRLLGGVFGRLAEIATTFPLGPVVDVFRKDLPLFTPLSEFLPSLNNDGQDGVTLVDLLTIFNQSGDFEFIQTILDVLAALELIGKLGDLTDAEGLELADVALSGEAVAALSAGETGALLENAFSVDSVGGGGLFDVPAFGDLNAALDSLSEVGLSIPLLEDGAASAIGEILLSSFLQKPVGLIEFQVPELALERDQASFFFSIPIGPFAFVIDGGIAASFDISVGYSTFGFLNAFQEGDGFDLVDFASGFYLAPPTGPDDEVDPVAQFAADLSAGFGIAVPGLRVTIDGGFTGEIAAELADGDDQPNDGLSHIGELPLPCIFESLSGELGAGVKLTFQVGVSIFSWKYVLSIAEVTIANFELGCDGPHGQDTPELVNAGLATQEGATLIYNIGARDDMRTLPNNLGEGVIDEEFRLTRMTQELDDEGLPIPQNPEFNADAFIVEAFGVRERFLGVTRVVGDGGDGNDVLTIDAGINVDVSLTGGIGEDVLLGGAGNDTINGGDDNDIVGGGAGIDVIDAGDGDDVIRASEGADQIEGGEGIDQIDYSASTEAVFLTRDGGDVNGAGGLAQGDLLTNVEYIIGSQYSDEINGDESNDNTLDGQDGDDTLHGGDGADFIIGGAGGDIVNGRGGGDDLLSYVTSRGGVTVDLASGLAYGADADGDVISRIEGLHGSMHEDALRGDQRANLLNGFAGDDVLEGRRGRDTVEGAGGNDTVIALGDGDVLDGGGAATGERDRDLLTYRDALGSVTARLAPALFGDGHENDDQIEGAQFNPDTLSRSVLISSFEDLEGSEHDDRLGGDYGDNRIEGGAGADIIDAEAGDDTVAGGAGGDDLEGGEGTDLADYSASNAGVTVNFTNDALNSGGHAEGDSLSGFENLLGSDSSDNLTGDKGDNVIDPGLGQDVVDGLGGTDILRIDYSGLQTAAGFAGGFDFGADPDASTGGFVFGPGGATSGVSFSNIEKLYLLGSLRGDIIFGGKNSDTIFGGGGNDVLSGNEGGDFLLAGEGNDLVFSELGENLLTIGDGGGAFFNIDGGAGYDGLSIDLSNAPNAVSLIMSAAVEERTDQLAVFNHGGVIRNFEFIGTVGGTAFSDTLVQEGDINNAFFTGGGDDTLAPGLGFDFVDGGETPLDPSLPTDADFLFLDYSEVEPGPGEDVEGVLMRISEEGNQIYGREGIAFGAQKRLQDSLEILNIEYANIIGTNVDDEINGINDEEYDLDGDTLEGLDGDDKLTTFNGDDLLLGGADADALDAGADDDTLQAGLAGRDDGNDVATGGAGADLFIAGDATGLHYGEIVEGAASADFLTITDFEAGLDQIQLTGRASDFTLITSGGATLVTQGFGRSAQTIVEIFEDGGPSGLSLNSRDFTFVREAAGGFTTSLKAAAPDEGKAVSGFSIQMDDLASAVEGLSLSDLQRTPIADDGGQSLDVAATRKTALTDVSPQTIQPLGELGLTDDLPDNGGIADPGNPFSVEQGLDGGYLQQLLDISLLAQGIGVSTGGTSFEGDARAFGTFENGLGLERGAVLSTGIATHLPGLNAEDGGLISNQFGGLTVDLDFQLLGTTDAPNNQKITYFVADLSGIPFDIASLVLKDDDDGVGGSAGFLSGADIDGLLISSENPFGGATTEDALKIAADSDLDLFSFDAANTVFTPGDQRTVAAQTLEEGADLPKATPSSANLAGSIGGYLNNEEARLDAFDYDGAFGGFLTLGDGGEVGFDLNRTLEKDEPAYLIVAEAGGSESFSSTFTASNKPLTPPGDLSTDFGAAGAENDRAKVTIDFLASLPDDQDRAFAHILDLVIASEELKEFSGTELQDKISIRLNGVNAISLSDGDAATLERLSESPVGPFHPDLILNPAEGAEVGTKADAYTIPIAIEGFLVNGQNRLEIEVMDQRDGFLDTALLLGATDGGIPIAPAAPPRAGFKVLEDGSLSQTVALPDRFAPVSVELVEGGGVDFGRLELKDDGSFIYTPDANAFGRDGFIFRATAADGEEVTGVVDLNVTSAPDAPSAKDDAFEVQEDEILTGNLFADNGSGRDGDADGQAFSIVAVNGRASRIGEEVTLASGSVLTVDADGAFRWGANGAYDSLRQGETATETFTYLITDETGMVDTAEATVTVVGARGRVEPPVDVPVGPPIEPPAGSPTETPGEPPQDPESTVIVDLRNDILLGTPGDDTIAGARGGETIYSGGGGDMILGGRGSDNIFAGAGQDTVTGGGGRDRIEGGDGADELSGNGGGDLLDGEGGRDLVLGGGGRDVISGGAGRDTMDGGAGADVISGDGGRDLIIGGRGADTLTGGAGADTFTFTQGSGFDRITDYDDRRDSILIERGADAFGDLLITQIGDDAMIRFANVRILLEDTDSDLLDASDFIF